MYDFGHSRGTTALRTVGLLKGGALMRERLPVGAAEIGAEVRKRTDQPPVNEHYLLDVTDLLREISIQELAEQRRRSGRDERD